MAEAKPDTALLEVDDVTGRMPEALRDRFYKVIAAALAETGRFRLLPREDMPPMGALDPTEEPETLIDTFASRELQHALLPRVEEITSSWTGQRTWKFTLLLYDLKTGRRLALREALLPADAKPEELRWLVYQFAESERYEELARGHRLAGLAAKPEALERDPEYLGLLLVAHLQKGSWEAAIEDARRLLKLEPGSALAWHALALALHRTGHGEEARQAVEESLKLNPNPEGWILKGDIQASGGDDRKALESYRSAAKLEGDNGARGKAKLSSLEYALGRERDPMLALRLGWMWGYLHYVGVMVQNDISEELKKHVLTVGAELQTQFRHMSGIHMARLVGLENWNAWVRALNAGSPGEFREASEAAFGSKEAVANLVDVLPEELRRWLRMSRELFWIQAVFYVTAQHWNTVGTDNPPRQEEQAFKVQAGLLAGDRELAARIPALGDLARRLERVAALPTSKDKLETAVGLIEEFRRALFEEKDEARTDG